jgi:hypothetical protein
MSIAASVEFLQFQAETTQLLPRVKSTWERMMQYSLPEKSWSAVPNQENYQLSSYCRCSPLLSKIITLRTGTGHVRETSYVDCG